MKRTVIVPAAGMASRMKPLSQGLSKSMIPVNGRPLISYIIENLDFDEMIIVENELRDIQEFVLRVYPEKPIKFVTQVEKKGPLQAISLGWQSSELADSAITIWLGDTICLDDFEWDKDFVAVHSVADPHRWCLIDSSGKLYDKPESEVRTNAALIGVYHFVNRSAFDLAIVSGMEQPTYKGEYQIAALLQDYQKNIEKPFTLRQTIEWYDCGELNTYYESKARLLKRSARSFNQIEVDTFYGTVVKSAVSEKYSEKIEREKNWFLNLNERQKLFCPRILESTPGIMKMTLEPGTPLNEVLVYDNIRSDVWHDIIRKILKVHHEVFHVPTEMTEEDYQNCFSAYFLKNRSRMKTITRMFGHPEVEEFVLQTSLEMCNSPVWSTVIHGDSHLGNIIYDPFSGSIKFVDPRGEFGNHVGNMGDLRYDMGKLLQDFYCGYSMIMADRYEMVNKKVNINWVGDTWKLSEFIQNELATIGYDVKLLKKIAIVLMTTAIPFHGDKPKRQQAFFFKSLNLIRDEFI
jgi:glucose-1-phosphate thymidylyltransferase